MKKIRYRDVKFNIPAIFSLCGGPSGVRKVLQECRLPAPAMQTVFGWHLKSSIPSVWLARIFLAMHLTSRAQELNEVLFESFKEVGRKRAMSLGLPVLEEYADD